MTKPSAFGLTTFWAGFQWSRCLRRRGTIGWYLVVGLGLVALRAAGADPRTVASAALLYVVPLMSLSFGTGALREEVEDQTLTYSFTRPLDRGLVYVAKVLAAMGTVGLVALVSAALGAASVEQGLRYAGVGLLATAAYTAVFGLLGLLLKRPAWLGIMIMLVWEHGLGLVPGFLKKLTLVTHLRSLSQLRPSSELARMFWEPPPTWQSLAVLVVVTGVALALGGLIVRRREFVLPR